jgi:hypothetical protein
MPQQSSGEVRLHGRWLPLAWAAWSVLALLSLIDFITSISEYLGVVQTPCRAGLCVSGQPTPETAQTLHQLGLLVSAYAGFSVGLVIVAGLAYCAVAAVIVWRKPTDWVALLTTRMLITQGLFAEKTLAAFSAALRNEVDLHQVCEQLIAVVQETVQPAHVSLWRRSPERRRDGSQTLR